MIGAEHGGGKRNIDERKRSGLDLSQRVIKKKEETKTNRHNKTK